MPYLLKQYIVWPMADLYKALKQGPHIKVFWCFQNVNINRNSKNTYKCWPVSRDSIWIRFQIRHRIGIRSVSDH